MVQEDRDDLRQPRTVQMEDDTMDSLPDQLRTPKGLQERDHKFECMTEEAVKTLNQVSHSKEVRNSVASKMLMRLMSIQDKGRAEAESSSDGESQQILRRTLQFHPESDSQLPSQSLREEDTGHQMSAGDPDDLMKVESIKDMDEVRHMIHCFFSSTVYTRYIYTFAITHSPGESIFHYSTVLLTFASAIFPITLKVAWGFQPLLSF